MRSLARKVAYQPVYKRGNGRWKWSRQRGKGFQVKPAIGVVEQGLLHFRANAGAAGLVRCLNQEPHKGGTALEGHRAGLVDGVMRPELGPQFRVSFGTDRSNLGIDVALRPCQMKVHGHPPLPEGALRRRREFSRTRKISYNHFARPRHTPSAGPLKSEAPR
jgi:hypothetical protein